MHEQHFFWRLCFVGYESALKGWMRIAICGAVRGHSQPEEVRASDTRPKANPAVAQAVTSTSRASRERRFKSNPLRKAALSRESETSQWPIERGGRWGYRL